MLRRRVGAVVAATIAFGLLAAIETSASATAVTAPPENALVSYQLGGAYAPEFAEGIVIRDATSDPAAGHYNICYLNGFQTQPDQTSWWKRNHANLLLKKNGRYVIDEQWNEVLFDTSNPKKRRALARIVGQWTDQCAAKGFNAVEFDNLDSHQRSRGRLTKKNSLAFAKRLVKRAHSVGLATGQKNASEFGGRARRTAHFDFAIAEECERYRECGSFTDVYGNRVIEIEYTDYPRAVFERACALRGAGISVVLRDRMLSPAGTEGYRYDQC